MHKRLKIVLAPVLIILASSNVFSQEQGQYKVGVGYASSLYSNREKFEFTLNGGEKIELNSANPVVYFSQKLNSGQTYRIAQVSGPRTCGIYGTEGVGTITNQDILVSANCGYPPLTIYKANYRGIENGERFTFADGHGRSATIPISITNRNLGGFPLGDTFTYKQTGGPRPCIITPASTIVTANPVTVDCDCRKKTVSTPPKPPTNIYDLVTRSTDNKILGTYYESFDPVIGGKHEDEGRYVAFGSSAKGIDGSSGKFRQIFRRDRKSGITKMISRTASGEEGNGNSQMAAISADGKTVAFESYATNLTSGDNSWTRDVYVWNERSNIVELVSKTPDGMGGNGESYEPVVSGDGSVIAYTSNASDIVKFGPVFSTPNVFVNNGGSTLFITKDYETGNPVGGYSPSISEDGTKIAFCAYTYKLVKNDNNNLWDIFLWENGKQELKRISVPSAGGERNQGNESSSRVVWPSISGDGNSIVYATTSTDLVNDDSNGLQDIFLYNIGSGSTKRISTAGGVEGDGDSPISQGERIGISYDGNWVTYNTNSTNLGVPKGNIVVQSTESGKIIPVTRITNGSTARPMISRHGYFVVAGCSETYDKRYPSSGIFAFYVNIN